MNGYEILDGALLNSFIGEGTKFKGEFELDGLLRIDGDFTGTIRTKGKVLVNGRAECEIYAGAVIISGIVKGNIFSTKHVEIRSTGMMIGDITTPRLVIEEGVIFCGNCKIRKRGEITKQSSSVKEEDIKEENIKEEPVNNNPSETSPENNQTRNASKNNVQTEIYKNYLDNGNKNRNEEEKINKDENIYIENKY